MHKRIKGIIRKLYRLHKRLANLVLSLFDTEPEIEVHTEYKIFKAECSKMPYGECKYTKCIKTCPFYFVREQKLTLIERK